MAKSIFISMILALQCFLTGCSTVREDPFIGVDNLSLDDVRVLLSKELTVNELYEKIGPPIVVTEQNWGNIIYKTAKDDYLFFSFKGPYVVGAKYGETYINGISSNVLRLNVRNTLSKQPINDPLKAFTFEYVINGQSFNDYSGFKKYLLKLPKKYVVEYDNSCLRLSPDQPFTSNEQIEDFKSFCQKNDIVLIWHYSG
jgi:hypothetical protein